jgi:hypothetical protein
MSIFRFVPPEEGVEEAALADIAAAEKCDFRDGGRWEGAEVGGAVEEVGWGGVEEGVCVFQLGVVWRL